MSRRSRLAAGRIAISWVSVAEVYEGAFCSPAPGVHLAAFRRWLHPYRILGLNEGIAERFAETRADLRRRGQRLPDLDLFIAATAIHHDLTLLTFNLRHFQRVPDLKVFTPT
jgi:predicted nucleic acid-binding protein